MDVGERLKIDVGNYWPIVTNINFLPPISINRMRKLMLVSIGTYPHVYSAMISIITRKECVLT